MFIGMSAHEARPCSKKRAPGMKVQLSRLQFPLFVRWIQVLFLVRIGEASHPGPCGDNEGQFVVGCFNPSGLNGKASQVGHLMAYGDVWCVSETHLSTRALHSFRAGLHAAGSPFKYLASGYPVPTRSDKTLSGQWRGVATLSKYPTRSLNHGWHADLHETSRINVTATLIGDLWLTMGTFYGIPDSSAYPHSEEHNDILLTCLVDQVAHLSHGCRIVAGDFNLFPNQVAAQRKLEQAGFADLQSIAEARWGVPPQPTCKGCNRRDFVYVSVELQALLTGVFVDHEAWPDHSPLSGTFRGHTSDVPRFVWPMPGPCEWPSHFDPDVEFPSGLPSSQAYPEVWARLEQAAAAIDPAIPPTAKGRGRRCHPKKLVGVQHAPIRNSRLGEVTPDCLCPSLKHCRWFKQLRRLQSFHRSAAALTRKVPTSDNQIQHVMLWSTIRRAKGFHPSFDAWYAQSEHKVVGAPAVLSDHPPDADTALAIFQSFHLAVRALEKQLRSVRHEYAKVRRAENPNLVFKDIRAPQAGSVDLLLKPLTCKVESFEADTRQIVCDGAIPLDPAQPVYCRGNRVNVIHLEHDSIWTDAVDIQVRAVRTAAWPRGLHGVASTTISGAHLLSLRTGAMKGINADGAGVSGIIHLSCIESATTDPEFWIIQQTLRSVRDCGTPGHVRSMMVEVAQGWSDAPKNSVTHTLVARLHALGWSVTDTGVLQDAFGTFDLFEVSFQELLFRAEQAWYQVVAQTVCHRQGMQQFAMVDVEDTRRWVNMLSHQDAGTFRTLLNGAFFTGDFAAHWTENEGLCHFCPCEDGRYHRFWQCDAFAPLREDLDKEVWDCLPTLPEVLTAYGWSLLPANLHWWWGYLCEVPQFDIRNAVLLPRGANLRIFTDGSCFHQQDPQIRYAAWAVVAFVGSPTVIAKGPLPGLIQTSFRAELYAVVMSVEIANVSDASIHLVCDNEAVVKGFRRLCRGGLVRPNMPNSDLWGRLARALNPARHSIEHIRSHQDPGSDPRADAWLNGFADRTAVRANLDRPDDVQLRHAQHVDDVYKCRGRNRQIQKTLLRISQEVFKCSTHAEAAVDDGTGESVPKCMEQVEADPWCWHGSPPPGLTISYGLPYIALVQDWLDVVQNERVMGADGCVFGWISCYHLFLDFQLTTGNCGPIYQNGSWIMFDPHAAVRPINFKVRCRWWTKVLTAILNGFGTELVRRFGRPVSDVICLHAGCFMVSWPERRLGIIESWFGQHLRSPATRAGTSAGDLCVFNIKTKVFRTALPVCNNGVTSMAQHADMLFVAGGDGRIKALRGFDIQWDATLPGTSRVRTEWRTRHSS
eukprot:Skav232069  [mRNA]  locus=scaffold1176:158618:172159:- [translate_table: standard]